MSAAAVQPVGQVAYAGLEKLKAWRSAGANPPTVAYAWGLKSDLDPAEPVVALVEAWIAAGEAMHHNGRDPVTGGPICLVRILTAPERAQSPAAGDLHPREIRLMAVLRKHAGDHLPAYSELADLARLRDRRAARYLLAKLQRSGLVEIETLPAGGRRAIIREH